jgi:outer membrane protein assembly factor BamB
MNNRILVLGIAVFLQSGCGRKNPVNEISVADSGITIRDAVSIPDSVDWNAWRGPTNDGVVPPQDLVTEWDDQTNIRWRSEIPGRGHGSPIVVGSSVFVSTALDDKQQQCVICLDRKDGAETWRTIIHQGNFPAKNQIHKKGTNANGTIACDGERLFTAMLNSDAIIATTLDLGGQILWQREIGKFVSRFGYAPSPILYKSLVIFAADNQGGGYIAALDAATGEIAWRVARDNISSYSSPIVANVGQRDQLLISGCGAVTSYDPTTGQQLWRTEAVAEATCGTIVTTSDLIFASGGYPEQETVCLSADGKRIWSQEMKAYEPSMLISGDKLVAINDGGVAFCWLAATGDLVWKKRLGGNFSASPILSDGNIYVSNLDGDTFVFQAGQEYTEVAKNKLGDDCYASPAASDGELFLRIGMGQGQDRREQVVCIAADGGNEKENSAD